MLILRWRLLCDVHIHSTSDNVSIRDTDFSSWQYYDKNTSKEQVERVYCGDKASYTLGRGQRWFVDNRRPHRLKHALKELDELILDNAIIFTKWRSTTFLQLILQNSVLVNIVLNKLGDISKVTFDKFLVGKFHERPTDVYFSEKTLVLVFLGLYFFNKY